MALLESFRKTEMGRWKEEFEEYRVKIEKILKMIDDRNETFYPSPENVFKSFEKTPLEKVKVVVWGQDPYPSLLDDGTPRAQGYAFGVSKKDFVPKSLQNIYKEIKNNFDFFVAPTHGDLTWLTDQGILFINTSFTYCPENPKGHLNLWTRFIHIVIKIINKNIKSCIHVMWGKQCEKLRDLITSPEILTAAHPSPLSAYRGFFGCNHFKQINITLDRQEKTQINWNENLTLKPTFVISKKA